MPEFGITLRVLIIVLLVNTWQTRAISQVESVLMPFISEVKPDRYDDIEGSPYFFKGFVRGMIIQNDATIYENVLFNYNGETKTIEVFLTGRVYSLKADQYLRAEAFASGYPNRKKVVFQRGVDESFKDEFVIVVWAEQGLALLKQFRVMIERRPVDAYEAKRTTRTFSRGEYYFIKQEGKVSNIRLRDKAVLSYFDSDELNSYAEKADLELDQEQDLIDLLEYYVTEIKGRK